MKVVLKRLYEARNQDFVKILNFGSLVSNPRAKLGMHGTFFHAKLQRDRMIESPFRENPYI